MIWLLFLQDRLPLEVSTPARSVQGVVHLADEASIAHLVTAFAKDDISLEVKQNKLFVKLLREVEGSIDCIGASGQLYRIAVAPSAGSAPTLTLRRPRAAQDAEVPPPLQLIQAMRLGRPPEGAVVTRSSAVVAQDASIVVQLQWVYRLDDLIGFDCLLRNRSPRPIALDPSRFKDAIVVGVRDMKLAPGESTRIWLVIHE